MTAFEVLTGRHPFADHMPAGLSGMRELHEHRSLPADGRILDKRLDSILRKCCAKRPDDRYPSWSDLLNDWPEATAGEPESIEVDVENELRRHLFLGDAAEVDAILRDADGALRGSATYRRARLIRALEREGIDPSRLELVTADAPVFREQIRRITWTTDWRAALRDDARRLVPRIPALLVMAFAGIAYFLVSFFMWGLQERSGPATGIFVLLLGLFRSHRPLGRGARGHEQMLLPR